MLDKLETGIPIVLLVVVKASGSTPGRQGFKMLISKDSTQLGTIGGGAMEFNFIKLAKECLKLQQIGFRIKVQMHHKYAPEELQSGLICSGEQWIAYGVIEPTQENKNLFGKVIGKSNKQNVLQITPEKISLLHDVGSLPKDNKYKLNFNSESEWIFKENLQFRDRLYIFGGGHVGLALSRIFSTLDFYIVLIDNRKDVKSIKDNTYTDEIIIDEYNNTGKYIEEGTTSYIAVVTTSMPTDVEAITAIIEKDVRYIGVMGSKSKKKEIFNKLSKKGITGQEVSKIKMPIGINGIKTHSAEEIAISIAAEIIKIKNQ